MTPTTPALTRDELWELVGSIPDPEIPVVDIAGLGILRDIRQSAGGLVVTITPTYSGCPAMAAISADIESTLTAAGYPAVAVETRLSPAWTTDWMSAAAKEALTGIGIAPPHPVDADAELPILCPQCSSADTRTISPFGSTACKALMVCTRCLEPFDHFKSL